MGPLLFNAFINDTFYFIVQCILYNYADDNTLSFIHKDFTIRKSVLEQESNNLVIWFFNNFMNANPDKFQVIFVGKNAHDSIEPFLIGQANIKCEENVTLLGINIDFRLRFDNYVSYICKKASKQLAVLKGLGNFLTKQGKLVIYNSFIASCSAASTNKLERIQERVLRFISNDYTSSLSTLISDSVKIKASVYDFRDQKKAEVPRVNSTRYGLRSFTCRSEVTRVWNSLPNEVRLAETNQQFRRLMRA